MDWTIILGLAPVVVGIMEYLKGFIPKESRDKIHPSVYRLALAGLSAGVAIFYGGDFVVLHALAITAMSQIGYEAFIRYIKKMVENKGQ